MANSILSPKLILSSPIHFFAFGFGSGLSPKAPGTLGTLAAIPLYLLLVQLPWWGYAVVVMLAIVVGVWLCGESSRRLGVHDHSGIVWDEFVGLWITLFAMPVSWLHVLLGFALFRLFDIWKPWPIRYLDQNMTGGWGIMLDDVVAGLMAWLCLLIIHQTFLV